MAFCGRCGTKLAPLCPACGFANPEGFAFCGKCGARVGEAPSPPRQGSAAFASPQSYTPKHLAEKILTSKAALEGERKQVTVLRRPQELYGTARRPRRTVEREIAGLHVVAAFARMHAEDARRRDRALGPLPERILDRSDSDVRRQQLLDVSAR
jgi:hypothetical protein